MKLIKTNDYSKCCDLIFNDFSDNLPDNKSIVCITPHNIVRFFEMVKKTNNKYIVLNPYNDVGFSEQKEEPVYNDTSENIRNITVNQNYEPIFIRQSCDISKCKISDKYSFKTTSFTFETFNEIPSNIIRWYSANNNINDDRIIQIPIGLPDWSYAIIENMRKKGLHKNDNRTTSLYFNMTLNTLKRNFLFNEYSVLSKNIPNIIVLHGNQIRTHEEYLLDISNSYCTLCLEGNGYDTYRSLESIYLGSYAAYFDYRRYQKAYDDTPYINLFNHILDNSIVERKIFHNFNLETTKANMEYWEKDIKNSRELLI